MFNALYEFTLGNNFPYMSDFATDNVNTVVGLVTLLVSIGLCAIYYLGLNRATDKYDQISHWGGFFGITVVFAAIFAFWQARHELHSTIGDDTVMVPILFWVMNMIYSVVYFMLGSLAFRKLSKYATKIPF